MATVTKLLITLLAIIIASDFTDAADDSLSFLYPGQVNLGLIVPIRRRQTNRCGDLDEEMVRSVMSCIWAIHQVNSRKEARQLNLGLYLYDTCGRQDLVETQVSRLMEHLSLRRCPGDSRPPIAGVIALGDPETLDVPARILSAFAVPLITTNDIGPGSTLFTTLLSPTLLIRALVSLANFSKWTNIALITRDGTSHLKDMFKEQASKENIDVEDITTTAINDTSAQAIAVFQDGEKNITEIVDSFKDVLEIPIVLAIPKPMNINSLKDQFGFGANRLIVISPEDLVVPKFEEFWREELSQGNSSEHPFVRELMKSNDTAMYDHFANTSNDVSQTVTAIWMFAEALESIQNRICNHGNDCISLIKELLNSDIVQELKTSNFTINDVFQERNASFGFDQNHKMLGGRIAFHLLRQSIHEQDETSICCEGHVIWGSPRGGRTVLALCNYLNIFGWYGNDVSTNLPTLNITSMDFLVPPTKTSSVKGPRSSSLLSPSTREVTSASVSWRNYSNQSVLNGGENDEIYNVPTNRGSSSLAAWVSRPWSLAVIVLSTVGILATIYILSFLLMKSCEGALKKRNQPLLFLTLIAMALTFASAVPFVFPPSSLLCGISRVCHNISLTFLTGSLLLQAMHLRSQELLGLGGRVSRFNQMITLGFIIGVQIAIETQQWVFRKPDFDSLDNISLCTASTFDFATSQIYIAYLVLLGVIVSYSSRNVPYSHREGQCLWLTDIFFLVAFVAKLVLYCVLNVAEVKILTQSVGLIILSYVVLAGIYIPYLYDVHRQGGLPHKPLSYAESMSTVFTMFKHDGDSVSGESTTSRGRKGAKTLERPEGIVEMTHNPLYDNFSSVYA